MKIITGLPPMYEEIDAVFHVRGRPVIFTWGDTIYNPGGGELSAELRAHEGVHYQRQTNDTSAIEAWWRRYLIDPEFRLGEELPAHRAEYRQYVSTHRDRNQCSRFLNHVAGKLAAPLYGSLITSSKARTLIHAP